MAKFSNKQTPDSLSAFGEYESLLREGFSLEKDYREPEHRQELFNRYFNWRVLSHDLDHIHYYSTMCEDYGYEQKAWFALTFGMTYRTPQSFAYTETFPDIHAVSIDEIEKWHVDNWKRTTYGTDARYNKGHFVTQTRSVKDWLNGKTFKQKFDSILVHDTEKKNFNALFAEILTLYKFGRMTGWLTMQALHDLLHLPIDPNDILLDGYSPNNDSSLGSIWNGLCALTNQHEKMVGKYGNYTCTEKDIAWGKEALMYYTGEAEKESGFKIDSYRLESIWCQYKRLFGEAGSKEYAGHSSGDAASRYLYYRENWPEIDWSKFRRALREQPGYIKGATFVDWQNSVFGKAGLLMNMSELYDDIPDAYKLMDINPAKYKIKEVWTDDNLPVPDFKESTFKEDLKTTPKYYTPL